VKKALTTIVAAAGLVILVVPAADATLDRSLLTTHSQAKVAEVAKKATKAKHAVRAASISEKGNPSPAPPNSIPPRAARIGDQLVLVIPQETSDPGDRRPR
jgi:hypothetical protein